MTFEKSNDPGDPQADCNTTLEGSTTKSLSLCDDCKEPFPSILSPSSPDLRDHAHTFPSNTHHAHILPPTLPISGSQTEAEGLGDDISGKPTRKHIKLSRPVKASAKSKSRSKGGSRVMYVTTKLKMRTQHCRPALRSALKFELTSTSRRRVINIPQKIGTKYRPFGILLLEDDDGDLVEAIVHDEMPNGVLNINLTILRKWLKGTGKPPTWASLIEVLRDIDLKALASDIEQECHCRGWV